jgi:hypothetical protein
MNDTILLFLSNALTGIAAWFVGKRKTNAETDNLVLSNLEKSIVLEMSSQMSFNLASSSMS